MYRSMYPIRSARVRRQRATGAGGRQAVFALNLAGWLDRLAPGNRALPAAAADQAAEPPVLALPRPLAEQPREAA